ncbi:MAG: hypothetical protein OEM52_10240 [bacterium]|nr:hypothetical protein [bacterium]
MNRFLTAILLVLLGGAFALSTFAQPQQMVRYKGDRLYRYKAYHNGNKVSTVFYNYGLIGNLGELSGEWPQGTGDEYIGDVNPLIGIEFVHPNGDTLRSAITTDGPRGNTDGTSQGGTAWVFEPIPGFAAMPQPGAQGRVAMSHLPSTWPDYWPDKMYTDLRDYHWKTDVNDPGWRRQWNGYFGKDQMQADQESYFVVDDQADVEWFSRPDRNGNNVFFYPDSTDSTRRGLGIRMTVRGLQWSHFLAEDCIFWLYDVTNVSTTPYDKVAFGMVVGTLSGGRNDSRDDLAYFEIENDITYSWDSDDVGSPGWVPVRPGQINVGYAGYAFLESPGNSVDGIDNDGDDDSVGVAPTLNIPLITQMTDPHVLSQGDRIVIIDYNTYARTVVTLNDTIRVNFRGREFLVYPGIIVDEAGSKGRNGYDDNYNGLIDERQDHAGRKYKNYVNNLGILDRMIDEARDDGIDNDMDWSAAIDDVGEDGKPATGDTGEGDGVPTAGEPNFDQTDVDESDQIGLTSFEYFSPPTGLRMHDDDGIWDRMSPGRFDNTSPNPEDGDFIYGSGYFPLLPGQTERFSMALLFGEDLQDITDNKITVQKIYNENYRFARPPEKPTVKAVAGDGKVTLYWDDAAERSFDPVNGYDFEGYKIYRSTDAGFLETFTITDGRGRKVFNRPQAQFDLNNENYGYFPLLANGASFYLGDNSGLQHVWTDTTVENGQTYYYAICSYDRGDATKNIFPAETPKSILVDVSGELILDKNTAVAKPVAPSAGYIPAQVQTVQHISGGATGQIFAEILDPRNVRSDATYNITFVDSAAGTIAFHLLRTIGSQTDTVLWNQRFLNENLDLRLVREFSSYYEEKFGIADGTYDASRYFDMKIGPVVDGHRLFFLNPRTTSLIVEASKWLHTAAAIPLDYSLNPANYSQAFLTGREWPSDYDLIFYPSIVDTTMHFQWYPQYSWGINLPAKAVNFRVYNRTRGEFVTIAFDEANSDTVNGGTGIPARWDPSNVALIFERTTTATSSDTLILTWALTLKKNLYGLGDIPQAGDTLALRIYLPFSGGVTGDRFNYSLQSARVDKNSADLSRIRVYPNPYVAASTQEPSNSFSSGRGERRITFTHLPSECKIRIYTVRGDLVKTIDHRSALEDGTETWDLRSKDGLNIAYGVYIYHIDSPLGKHVDRFAVIK